MSEFAALVACGFLLLLAWKHWQVIRFFRRPIPPADAPALVSILQPILSSDPTMPDCLQRNLLFQSRYNVEYLWLIDTNDAEAKHVCEELANRHAARPIRIVAMPPPGQHENPKMAKLIEGARLARGDVLCVLDDDTVLPDGGLEQCLPFLDEPNAGLAFGLPYYRSFQNLWSRLIACFVNSNSLLTYIPYRALTDPFTINGMFYALRRSTLERIGGFAGLENTLADDFAIAQRVRSHGYRLVQTPLRHAISTYVTGPRHYLNLIQRWFIFPRESLMRYLAPRQLLLLYGMAMLPALFPLLIVVAAALFASPPVASLALVYLVYSFIIFAHFNVQYLGRACPWSHAWLVPVIQLIFPIQLLIALLSPQRISWRGHQMQVQKGGGFEFVRRRTE